MKEMSCYNMQGVKSLLRSFVNKLNFQAVIFAIIFLTINGHTKKS